MCGKNGKNNKRTKRENKMEIKTIKTLMLKDTRLGNHITTTILVNCINQLLVMIPDDNIRHLIEGAITESEDILEQQEDE